MIDYNSKQRILPHGLINPKSIKELFDKYPSRKSVNLSIHFSISIASMTSLNSRKGESQVKINTNELIRLSGMKFKPCDWNNRQSYSSRMNKFMNAICDSECEAISIGVDGAQFNELFLTTDWNIITPIGGAIINYHILTDLIPYPTAYRAYLLISTMTHRHGGYMNKQISLKELTELGWNCNTKNPRETKIKVKNSLKFLSEKGVFNFITNDDFKHFSIK